MADDNISQVKEMIINENHCFNDSKPMKIIEETSVETMDEQVHLSSVTVSNGNVTNPVNLRRFSTGRIENQGSGKAHAQTRYRGNQMSSTHDLCKHGKRRDEDDLVIKPWKLVKKKNVASGDLRTNETKKSLMVAKREGDGSEIVESCDDLHVQRSETKSTRTSLSGSSVVRKAKKTNLDLKKSNLDVKKTNLDVKKTNLDLKKTNLEVKKTNLEVKNVSRIGENKNCKEDLLKNNEKKKIDEPVRYEDVMEKRVPKTNEKKISKEDLSKNLKNKQKMKIDEPVGCDLVLEKTLYVVESTSTEEKKKKMKKKSIKSVKSEEVKEPRVTRSDPKPVKQTTSRSKTGFSEKKESDSSTLVTNSKTERPKKIGLKANPSTKPLSFKKGKVLELKQEDSTSTLIKFKKRVVQEPKLRNEVNKKKKNLKDKREGVGKIINGEGKREKVVLRHRKVESKKKLQTLFNNVIEEAVNKLEEVRKSKVQALVGAFETVISLQDDHTKTSQKEMKNKIQSKSTSSQVVEG